MPHFFDSCEDVYLTVLEIPKEKSTIFIPHCAYGTPPNVTISYINVQLDNK